MVTSVYADWWLSRCAPIYSLPELQLLWLDMRKDCVARPQYVVTSGGYDPIHPGHISCIQDSRRFGALAVVVNGDWFLTKKKGKPFLDLKTRCQIVSAIKGVDYVVPFEVEDDMTVNRALEALQPTYFTKGGDRTDPSNIPEWKTCEQNGIAVVTGLGLPKLWSSSEIVANARSASM